MWKWLKGTPEATVDANPMNSTVAITENVVTIVRNEVLSSIHNRQLLSHYIHDGDVTLEFDGFIVTFTEVTDIAIRIMK